MFDNPGDFGRGGRAFGLLDDVEPKVREFLAQKWPAISVAITRQVGTAAVDALRDERLLGQAAGIVYGFLPPLVRLVVDEQAFVGYVSRNRSRVLEWVTRAGEGA